MRKIRKHVYLILINVVFNKVVSSSPPETYEKDKQAYYGTLPNPKCLH